MAPSLTCAAGVAAVPRAGLAHGARQQRSRVGHISGGKHGHHQLALPKQRPSRHHPALVRAASGAGSLQPELPSGGSSNPLQGTPPPPPHVDQDVGAPGMKAMDFSNLIYLSAAFYVPAGVYALAALALTLAPLMPTAFSAAVAPFVKLVLSNFAPLMKAHHMLLNLALCFSIIPSLRAKFPRFARDHLLESNFMATLSLDLLPIYLNFAVKGTLLHYTCLLLAVAVVALSVYSSLNVLRISLTDPRDTFEARATTVIWAIILTILGVCTRKFHYFLFIGLLVWLRWQRFRRV